VWIPFDDARHPRYGNRRRYRARILVMLADAAIEKGKDPSF